MGSKDHCPVKPTGQPKVSGAILILVIFEISWGKETLNSFSGVLNNDNICFKNSL